MNFCNRTSNNFSKDFLFALTGFVFFMAVGANVIDATRKVTGLNHAAYNGFGSMCIITSFVFLVDVVFSALNLKKD